MKKPKYVSLITKVNYDTARGLKRIEMKKGLSVYGMLQMMCDCIRRYMDSAHNLSEEIEQAMSIFEHMEGWKDALNLAEPSVDKVIGEAYSPEFGTLQSTWLAPWVACTITLAAPLVHASVSAWKLAMGGMSMTL